MTCQSVISVKPVCLLNVALSVAIVDHQYLLHITTTTISVSISVTITLAITDIIITFVIIPIIIAMFVAVLYILDGCTSPAADVMDCGPLWRWWSRLLLPHYQRHAVPPYNIIYSGITTPCSPLHIWKPWGHVGVPDHLPGGGPLAFLLWPTSHVVCLCWTEPGVKMHRRFMFWKWSKIEFCFETLLGSKCDAAGLIVCDERIVVCNWSERSVLMGSAVRWSETCFFSWPTHIKYTGLRKNKITVFSCMWTNVN